MIRPQDYKELFNYRHAQLRNVIERTFGVLKKRFKILVTAQEYSLEDQARLVSALAVVHNFIRLHDPNDNDFEEDFSQQSRGRISRGKEPKDEEGHAAERRERIALAMWRDYKS
jgi:hypothetical protein